MNPLDAGTPFAVGPKGLIARPGLPLREILTIGMLPSDLKLWLYRRRGWKIGRDVAIGPGSVLVGDKVNVGDGVSIGALSILRASDMTLARGARIGRNTVLAVPRLSIGEDAEVDDHVWASAGYARAESSLDLGGFTILMRHSYVNCAMGVTVGEGSGIGGHCLIFTHGYWLSWLEGYPRQLAPVAIGRDVWLPWRVFVMPGAVIGDGCVIGANSTVSGRIEPLSLAAGSPAVVTKTFKGKLPVEEVWRRLQAATDDFLAQMGHQGIRVEGRRLFDLSGREGSLCLVGPNEMPPVASDVTAGDTVVSIAPLPPAWREAAERAGVPWFDIGVKERSDRQNPVGRELAAFLSGYGMRFRRC
jgi:acetyltransferase-like isoleucine patch superfamily enzyme